MKQGTATAGSRWVVVHDTGHWDAWLGDLGGHPLQSLLWGNARREAEGIDYRCLAVFDGDGKVQAMARVEARRVPLLGTFAWIPRGPVTRAGVDAWPGLEDVCRALGYVGLAASPWEPVADDAASPMGPRTIWLDLTRGRELLLQDMDVKLRHGVRRALRDGLVISSDATVEQVRAFHGLCLAISARKGFDIPASEALMQQLLQTSQVEQAVEARLFVATLQGALVGGAYILRAGSHLHYLWGAVDRAHARVRAGDALQWAVIEWGLAQHCTLYDLEGIDPVNNPGTYEFKKKLGGKEIRLHAELERALDWRGTLLLQALRIKRRLKHPAPAAAAVEA